MSKGTFWGGQLIKGGGHLMDTFYGKILPILITKLSCTFECPYVCIITIHFLLTVTVCIYICSEISGKRNEEVGRSWNWVRESSESSRPNPRILSGQIERTQNPHWGGGDPFDSPQTGLQEVPQETTGGSKYQPAKRTY